MAGAVNRVRDGGVRLAAGAGKRRGGSHPRRAPPSAKAAGHTAASQRRDSRQPHSPAAGTPACPTLPLMSFALIPGARPRPDGLRDLFGYRWAFRCSTEASSDTILGHEWANAGYSATEIDPQARGVSWLRAEDGIPRRVKAAYLTDEEIIYLADWAAQARSTPPRR